MITYQKYLLLCLIGNILLVNSIIISNPFGKVANALEGTDKNSVQYVGVNVKGYYTSLQNARYATPFPDHYYDQSFKLISTGGMNHIRYVFYWEAYEKNPTGFIKELETVARSADRWGLKVVYDSHQFHTSSWLDPENGTGFPPELFQGDSGTPYGGGGTTADPVAKVWWTKWWNRNITNTAGKDGWSLYANFLKKIVKAVDNHESTLGYEILNEPQIHSSDEWHKIGTYNSYITNQLRKITDKTIIYSMNVPISFKDNSIGLTPQNLASMAPSKKMNVVFKISVYGMPIPKTYQGEKFQVLSEAGKIAGVPMYIGEWNDVSREEKLNENGNLMFHIDPVKSNLTQIKADDLVNEFRKVGVWGMAFWNWNYVLHPAPNFNLVKVTESGHIETTKYFKMVERAISSS